MSEIYWFIWIIAVGACVGSFLNVVIYRLPEGKSIVTPPSACPKCGYRLKWYDNVPIFSWLLLRARCRQCKAPISVQYPLIELLTALLFAGAWWVYYRTDLVPSFGDWAGTWPAFIVHLTLLAVLLASTIIDARLFIIPLELPWFATAVAVVVLPLAAVWYPQLGADAQGVVGAAPQVNSAGVHLALGGAVGLGIAVLLLWLRAIPRSFEDEEEYLRQFEALEKEKAGAKASAAASASAGQLADGLHIAHEPHPFIHYPHARREVLKEMLFVAFPTFGALIGLLLVPGLLHDYSPRDYPLWVHVLGGVVCGYLIGGALVWYTRILGTLAFGKEAMGLGDVHLLGAVGAVLGAKPAVLVFFIAPFFGLLWAVLTIGVGQVMRRRFSPIPYGPHLAAAAVVVMLLQRPVHLLLSRLMGG